MTPEIKMSLDIWHSLEKGEERDSLSLSKKWISLEDHEKLLRSLFEDLEKKLSPCCGSGEYCSEGRDNDDETRYGDYNPPMNKNCDSIHRKELETIKKKYCRGTE